MTLRARPSCALLVAIMLLRPLGVSGQAVGTRSESVGAAARSLLLPGWGQLHQGRARGWAYLAVEAFLWGAWVERRGAGADFRTAYRDLAWNEGRVRSGQRIDGDWTYFENVSKWTRSGAFDREAALSGVQPETDPRTFNGSIWALARDLYLGANPGAGPGDPGYASALAYYEARAYDERLLWDWTGKDDQLARYKGLIQDSDDRYRQATTAVGIVLLNHLLSATDAYLAAGAGRDARLRVAPATRGRGWEARLRIGVGR